jgi:ERF superfamily protein
MVRKTTEAQREEAEAVDAMTDTESLDGTQADVTRSAIELFNPDFEALNLWGKIARITGMIGGVEKRGYNAFHKYPYALEGDVVAVVRQYLAAANIVIIPSVLSETRDGDLTRINVRYTVTDGNEFFEFNMPGYGSDKGDKGVYKAITGSNKYAIMKLFKIETGDDPEGDTRVDERIATHDPRPAPVVRQGERGDVQRGGHTTSATDLQIRRISETAKVLSLSRVDLVLLVNAVALKEFELPDDEGAQSNYLVQAIKSLTGIEAGKVLGALEAQAREVAGAPVSGY